MRVLPRFENDFSWEHIENIYTRITQTMWPVEDTSTLDTLLKEIQDYGLTSSEAQSFIWYAASTSDPLHAPTDEMLKWICDRYFRHFSEGRMGDWATLSQRLYEDRAGLLPEGWALFLSSIITDENTSGILEHKCRASYDHNATAFGR